MLSAILEDSVSRMLRKRTWPAGTDDNFIHCMLVPALLHTDPDSKESVLTDAAYGSWLLEKAVQEKENHHLQDAYDLGMNVLEIGSRAEDWQLVIHAAALLAELSYSLILFNDMEKLALAGCKAAMELNDAASATAAAQLCLKIGYNLFRQGRREESWKLYDFGTGLARKAGNENLALELQRQKCEGLLFAEKNGEALELMRSMPLLKAPGKGDKKQASRFQQYCSTYARVLTKNGCLKEAASYFKAGIDSFSPLSPARDLGRKGMLEYGLSNSLFLQNDLEGSFLMAAAALKDLERCYGKNSVELCDDLNQLGILCQKRGEYQMAEHMYRRSFDIRMQFYGAENLLTAISYRNLIAAVTLQSGRFCEEQHESLDAMYREAIRIHKKVTAEGNRIRTVFILNDYAGYLLERQQYAKAAAAAQEAFELADELENPRFVLFTCEKLAKASFMSGDEETGKNAALLGIETAKEHAMQTHPAAVRLQVLLQENA